MLVKSFGTSLGGGPSGWDPPGSPVATRESRLLSCQLAPRDQDTACHSSLASSQYTYSACPQAPHALCASPCLENLLSPPTCSQGSSSSLVTPPLALVGRITFSPPCTWTDPNHRTHHAELGRSVYLSIFHTCNNYTETLREINRKDSK